MNLEESANNLKYIKEVILFMEEVYEKAKTFKLDEVTHNSSLEKKYLKQLWELQAETARKNIIENEKKKVKETSTRNYFQKFINIFQDTSTKELTDLDKFNEFYNSLIDKNISEEHKLELPSIEIEFVALSPYLPNFGKTAEKIISDHIEFPYYSRRYHLSENDLSILKELKSDYIKENKEFTLMNCQTEFKNYLGMAVDSFTSKTKDLKQKSIFDLYFYEADNLVGRFNVDRLENMQNAIKEKKIIYDLFLHRYRKDLNDHSELSFTNLSILFSNSVQITDIIKSLNKNTLIFEECNAFSSLEYSFPHYPDTHEKLREIILEMKKQNLIPTHIEESIISGDKEFHHFFRHVVEKQNLHTELIDVLPINEPIKKKKLLKI